MKKKTKKHSQSTIFKMKGLSFRSLTIYILDSNVSQNGTMTLTVSTENTAQSQNGTMTLTVSTENTAL